MTITAAVNGTGLKGEVAQTVDLVVTDTVMPGGVSGVDVAKQAGVLRPGLPVLLTSGYAVETLEAKGCYRVTTPFLSKPFSRNALANAVRQLLSESRPRQGPSTSNAEHLP